MRSNTLEFLLQRFEGILSREGVEDVAMNGEDNVAWVFQSGKWHRAEIRFDAHDIEDLATVAAARRGQEIGEHDPLLGVDITDRLRLQVVLPPCAHRPLMVLRQGSKSLPTLAGLNQQNYFRKLRPRRDELSSEDRELADLYRAQHWLPFFEGCAAYDKTTLICGETGSGKTYFGKARIDAIPYDELLVLMADTDEHASIRHPNRVDMFWGKANVRALQLAHAALRMRIGVPVLGEIRDGEAALAFVSIGRSGHEGGVTTMHARDCKAAKRTLRTRIKETEEGRAHSDADIDEIISETVDVIVHCYHDRQTDERGLDDVWFKAAEMVPA